MASAKHINLLLDAELYAAVAGVASSRGLTTSQAVRDILRHGLGLVENEDDAGWREGFTRGRAEVRAAMEKALASITVGE